MTARIALGSIVIMFALASPAHAGGKEEIQKYFSSAASKVRAAEDPSEKRKILTESLNTMAIALDIVQSAPSFLQADRAGIERFKAAIQEKQDELAGNNGYERVSDSQLNTFSDYVVQDIEQAEMITISVVTLLLIIILIVLLV